MLFSHDGKILASIDMNRTAEQINRSLRLWDVATGTEKTSLSKRMDEAGIIFVLFSPDGQIIATRSTQDTLFLWDVDTGKTIRTFEGL